MKEESEKAGLKLNVQKTKIMASAAITSWQIEGEKLETVTYIVFSDSMVTIVMKLKDTCSLGGRL